MRPGSPQKVFRVWGSSHPPAAAPRRGPEASSPEPRGRNPEAGAPAASVDPPTPRGRRRKTPSRRPAAEKMPRQPEMGQGIGHGERLACPLSSPQRRSLLTLSSSPDLAVALLDTPRLIHPARPPRHRIIHEDAEPHRRNQRACDQAHKGASWRWEATVDITNIECFERTREIQR